MSTRAVLAEPGSLDDAKDALDTYLENDPLALRVLVLVAHVHLYFLREWYDIRLAICCKLHRCGKINFHPVRAQDKSILFLAGSGASLALHLRALDRFRDYRQHVNGDQPHCPPILQEGQQRVPERDVL